MLALTWIIRDLKGILNKVTAMQDAVKGKRFRRKVAAFFFGNANASKLKECCDDLDWAMKKFNVSLSVLGHT